MRFFNVASKIRIVCFCLASMALTSTSMAQSSVDGLTIMTEVYPPFNYEEDGKIKGLSTEVVGRMLELTGSSKTIADVQMLSWTRGYNLAQEAKNHALYSTTRTQSREKLFKWVGPIVPTMIGVIAKKDSNIKISSVEDLYKLRIGTVKDDIGHLLLEEAGMPKDRMESVLSSEQNYRKLIAGRVDAIAYEANVSKWGIKELGMNPAEYEVVYELKRADLYLAIQKDTSNEVVDLLQAKLDEAKADGSYEKILRRYLD
jgi:polar amino acid transport system substrate-binding protein